MLAARGTSLNMTFRITNPGNDDMRGTTIFWDFDNSHYGGTAPYVLSDADLAAAQSPGGLTLAGPPMDTFYFVGYRLLQGDSAPDKDSYPRRLFGVTVSTVVIIIRS